MIESLRETRSEASEQLRSIAMQSDFAHAVPELGVPWHSIRPEHPSTLIVNASLARELGLDPIWLESAEGVRFLLGNELAPGSQPVAQAYAGHQWGVYQPQLGDGRALLLGELMHTDGELRDLHLKGSGPTKFSRRGDGRAAVAPMLREYLMGEALHALGIPGTRALAVIATGDTVYRDDGFTEHPGAVLARTARSHLRVGTFQFANATGDTELLRRLADHAISRHAPAAAASEQPYAELLTAVIEAHARLVASWMLVGFVHGVMSTDNTTISGETIDFGPCAFLDRYDPAAVFSSIDEHGRYAYRNQPGITLWNLTRFAESLLPLLADSIDDARQIAMDRLGEFSPTFDREWLQGLRAKFGLAHIAATELNDERFLEIAAAALNELQANGGDFTRFFRAFTQAERGVRGEFRNMFAQTQGPGEWIDTWRALTPDLEAMDRVNPVTIPRNHLVDQALTAAADGDMAPFEAILDAVTHPFDERAEFEAYGYPAPPELGPHITYCGT